MRFCVDSSNILYAIFYQSEENEFSIYQILKYAKRIEELAYGNYCDNLYFRITNSSLIYFANESNDFEYNDGKIKLISSSNYPQKYVETVFPDELKKIITGWKLK